MASLLRTLPANEIEAWIDSLTDEEAYALEFDWDFNARPEQRLQAGPWKTELILAGRGWGKTLTGAQMVRMWAESGIFRYVNLIGATAEDAREIMILGDSGIMNCCEPGDRPNYVAHRNKLVWRNGCQSQIFTADAPERLRGKQHNKLWADELAAWRYRQAWDQAILGLRLKARGHCDNPLIARHAQAVVTTTPRPTPLVKGLIADETTLIVRGRTYDNAVNLDDSFIAQIRSMYEGTRLGRQELDAEVLDDNPDALWQRSWLDEERVNPDILKPGSDGYVRMRSIVIGVDPSTTFTEDSDECGIVVCGLGENGRGYVLEDASLKDTPEKWAERVNEMYYKWRADCVVAETNQGGDMVALTLRQKNRNLPVIGVHASKGKFSRAQPVSTIYEQRRISHVGSFPTLEDQMCEFNEATAKKSPDRYDAMVYAFTKLMVDHNGTGLLEHKQNTLEAEAAKRASEGDPELANELERRRKRREELLARKRAERVRK